MVGGERSGEGASGAQRSQAPEGRAWQSERREFSVTSREESLEAREACADAREAAADDREAEADAWLLEHDLLDGAEATARRKLRAERARLRREREIERSHRSSRRMEAIQDAVSAGSRSDYPLATRFAELSTHLFTTGSVSAVLDHLVLAAGEVVQGGDAVSVTLQQGEDFTTPAYRGDLAHRLDLLQYEHGEGPCLDSASSAGKAYAASDDLAAETPWPIFAGAATAVGGRSVLSLGLFPDASEALPRLGSLNFYARSPHAFERGDRDLGMLLAAHAGVALASTKMLSDSDLRNVNLERALQSRDVIGQAKGILMERQKLTPEQAFDKLRDASNRLNIRLSELAQRLAETGEPPPPR